MSRHFGCLVLPIFLIAAVSCSKETAGGGMQTEEVCFAVSMPEGDAHDCPEGDVKTSLGEKQGNFYPTLWKSGDRISLNGYSSNALAEDQDGVRKASFVFRGGLSSPFNILYPATESTDIVVFPKKQQYTAGSFDSEATPMCASTLSYEEATLRHLSSLVRIDVKSDAGNVALERIVLSAGGEEPLSGQFRVLKNADGLFTGEIQAEGENLHEVSMEFPDGGLALTSDAIPVYIAIPSGYYKDGFKVTLKTAYRETMMLSFFGGNPREIAPSKVLELPEVNFTADSEDILHIWDAEDFATLSSTTASTVFIHNDIDMSASAWKGCTNGFNGSIDGMGHTVSGIAAKAFTQKAANSYSLTIRNLTFKECQNTIMTFGGKHLELHNCTFIGNTSSAIPVISVASSAVDDASIKISYCDFIGNSTSATSGNNAMIVSIGHIPVYLTHCRFIDNIGANYGSAIHFSKSAGSLLAIDNCLFWGNRNNGSSDPAPLSIGAQDFILLNSTVVQSTKGYKNVIRCGATGGMDNSLLANNIIFNINAGGFSFNTTTTAYFIRSAGYNQFSSENLEASDKSSLRETYSWTMTGGAPGIGDNVIGVPDSDNYTVPSAANGYVWKWRVPSEKIQYLPNRNEMESLLASGTIPSDIAPRWAAFALWLKTVNKNGHSAAETDLYGNVRNTSGIWPGCYQE